MTHGNESHGGLCYIDGSCDLLFNLTTSLADITVNIPKFISGKNYNRIKFVKVTNFNSIL